MAGIATEAVAVTHPEHWFIDKIPVRNVWLLVLYASDEFKKLHKLPPANVGVEENPDEIADLVAEILAYGVERRLRRNLSWGYQRREAVLSHVRGRINLTYTERHKLLDLGKVACRFDEMTVDTPRNRYVRAALEHIAKKVNPEKKELAGRCKALARSMARIGVVGERPSHQYISAERYGRHDADDKNMVFIAQLAFQLFLPTEEEGQKSLPKLCRDEALMPRLFEKAVAGFYRVALRDKGWKAHPGKRHYWQTSKKSERIDEILPSMNTDIELEHADAVKRIIIDTKFAPMLGTGYYRDKTLRSAYIYQIYAYIRSQEGIDAMADTASGLLLHPCTNGMRNEYAVIQGHEIRFATVDLTASYVKIREQLLEVVGASD